MKFRAILAKSTTDKLKAQLHSPTLAQVTFDIYMDSPMEYSQLISDYFESEFIIEIKKP